jgi:hypothetical protein
VLRNLRFYGSGDGDPDTTTTVVKATVLEAKLYKEIHLKRSCNLLESAFMGYGAFSTNDRLAVLYSFHFIFDIVKTLCDKITHERALFEKIN